ncbi:MAG: cysteine hydrolase family protein [Clostridium sp.]
MKRALVIIDMQMDYFPSGNFPLWNTDEVLRNVKRAVRLANDSNVKTILVKHVSKENSKAIFFNEGTRGIDIHPDILELAEDCIIVEKAYADGFYETSLNSVLKDLRVDEILLCGMMTQNCVTHTAISDFAKRYKVKVIGDCCTTINNAINQIALKAMTTRVDVVNLEEIKFF